jgi:hypothetical protein
MADTLAIESALVDKLREVYDPEIPVNIYELGLIYEVDVEPDGMVNIAMTLTAPNCPVADDILEQVRQKVLSIEGVSDANIELVFDPPWDQSRMSEEAKLEAGLL